MNNARATFDPVFGWVTPLSLAHRLKSERNPVGLVAGSFGIPYRCLHFSLGSRNSGESASAFGERIDVFFLIYTIISNRIDVNLSQIEVPVESGKLTSIENEPG